MKRVLKSLIILLLVMVVSPVMAKEYAMSDTDIKVNLDDSSWYVFTCFLPFLALPPEPIRSVLLNSYINSNLGSSISYSHTNT